jgi:hypothetical protein
MRAWHGMIFSPDLCLFNSTSAQEDQSLSPSAVLGAGNQLLSESGSLYNPLARIQRYCLGEIRVLFNLRDERANY